MTAETAVQAVPKLSPEDVADKKPSTTGELAVMARDYLIFAVDKIEDHRGISAGRSVDKLREYAWLLGRDDVVSAMETASYEQYGAPKVRAFGEGMGWGFLEHGADSYRDRLERMSQGIPCTDPCEEGCGQ